MTTSWLAGAGVMAGVAVGWAVLFGGAVRLYENLAHACDRRRQR